MSLYKDQHLNFFKFAAVVVDEFPVALRKTFKSMWDDRHAGPPTNLPWDDSATVRNRLKAQEIGAKCEIPNHLSYDEWDCTVLFQATIYAKTFKEHDALGHLQTLSDKYVKPLHLAKKEFHTSVTSGTGNQRESTTLAIDQLRRLRNETCHPPSTRKFDKATFDQYMNLAGEAFDALGLSRETIDNIKGMREEDFPTEKVQRLERAVDLIRELQKEVKDVKEDVKGVKKGLEDLEKNIEELKGAEGVGGSDPHPTRQGADLFHLYKRQPATLVQGSLHRS